jgi:hypothetical protein
MVSAPASVLAQARVSEPEQALAMALEPAQVLGLEQA